jgi:rubrerythrin
MQGMKATIAERESRVGVVEGSESSFSELWLCSGCNTRFWHLGVAPRHCPACGAELAASWKS